jgi:outer membrane protein assembly factor BamB
MDKPTEIVYLRKCGLNGPGEFAMTIDQLIFVGLNGYALALDRDSGEIVWSNNEMKSGYVSLLLDGDRLIVSTNGYMYCLDPLSGQILWHNPLQGYGTAPASLLSVRGQGSRATLLQHAAEAARQSANAGVAATVAITS